MISVLTPRPIVFLSAKQMDFVDKIVREGVKKKKAGGARNMHGITPEDDTPEVAVGAAQAELALSLFLNVEWASYRKGGPDVGERTQVRSSMRERSSHSLIVRPRDLELYGDVPFVLVIQKRNRFEVLGWMSSVEATRVGKLCNGGNWKRPDAWFVHESLLHSLEELTNP